MPLPRRTPSGGNRSRQAAPSPQADGASYLLRVASAVWTQYFPSDHHIGIKRPDDIHEKYYSLVDDQDGRFQAANAFRVCFGDVEQWAPLIQQVRS
jgi:hypothetical protein